MRRRNDLDSAATVTSCPHPARELSRASVISVTGLSVGLEKSRATHLRPRFSAGVGRDLTPQPPLPEGRGGDRERGRPREGETRRVETNRGGDQASPPAPIPERLSSSLERLVVSVNPLVQF